MKDIDERYKKALVEEHASYVQAGRIDEAEHVATVLKDQYGHDVAGEPVKSEAAPERADVEKPPENTAEPKPRRTVRAKPGQADSK